MKVIEKRRVDPKRRDKILESECAALRRLQVNISKYLIISREISRTIYLKTSRNISQHPNIVGLHEIFDTKVRGYFLVFVPTIREIRDFYRET
eukprot:SAG31_NODE_3909_length_3762_cov_2.740923_2_plen_93_part_00